MTPASPDAPLVSRLRAGETAAFEEIVLRHRGPVYGYFRARLPQASDADGLTRDVFLRFYAVRNRLGGEPIRSRLLDIAWNRLHEHVRAAKRRQEVGWAALCLDLEATVSDISDAADDEAHDRLPGCLDGLGPSAREAIELTYRGDGTLARVAERLRRSEGAVKLLVFQARRALRHCLAGRGPADTPDGRAEAAADGGATE